VPTGRTKTIQPLEAGTVTAIRVRDGDKVREGEVLLEIDRTISTAERNRVGHELLRAGLDVARLAALRAGLANNTAGEFTPPPQAPTYEVLRARAAMLAQAEQQAAKILSLDQQIAQKAAGAEGIAALIEKLKPGYRSS
jgi:hemolysin D